MNVGDIIAKLRKEKGITQSQLGKEMSISSQAISKWENNISSPDFDTMLRLSKFFNVSIYEFVPKEEHHDIPVVNNEISIDLDYIDELLLNKKPNIIKNILFSLFWCILSILFMNNFFDYDTNSLTYKIFEISIISLSIFSLIFHNSYNSNVKKYFSNLKILIKYQFNGILSLLGLFKPITLIIYICSYVILSVLSILFLPYNIITYKRSEVIL